MRLVNRACLLANKGLNQNVFWWHYRCPDGSLAKFCKEPEVLGRKGTAGNPWASSFHLHSTENCHVIIIKHETQCASQDHTLRRKWKLQRTAEYCKTNFEEFDIVMFDITSKSKLFYKEKSRMQKRRAFHLISNTGVTFISFVFSLWIRNAGKRLDLASWPFFGVNIRIVLFYKSELRPLTVVIYSNDDGRILVSCLFFNETAHRIVHSLKREIHSNARLDIPRSRQHKSNDTHLSPPI